MKKYLSLMLALVLAASLMTGTVFAREQTDDNDFIASVTITESDDTIIVTVANSGALETYQPSLTVNCDFDQAYVTDPDGNVIESVLDTENDKITFTVERGGTYTIDRNQPTPPVVTPTEPTQPSEPPTQPTEPPTQPTEPPATEAPTEPPTEAPTQPTEPPTETPTEPPTEPPTEAPTRPERPDRPDRDEDEEDEDEPVQPTQPATQPTTEAPTQPDKPQLPLEPVELPFEDVQEDQWYADGVQFVYQNGLMKGVSEEEFGLDDTTNRAMVMTMLARLEGQDTDTGATWYEDGMEWAKVEGISDGAEPLRAVSRQELVTMLWRWAGQPRMNDADLAALGLYGDAAHVSDWAYQALAWAVSNGIITGRPGGVLDPLGTATRAEVATVFMRLMLL